MSLPHSPHRRYSGESDVYAKAEIYYGDRAAASRKDAKNRTFSARVETGSHPHVDRRLSLDAQQRRKFLIPVDSTLQILLAREDTDQNSQITIDDGGHKVLNVGTDASDGFKQTDIRGTYMLSNLLQELTLAQDHGRKQIVLDEARLNENPVDRLSRFIRDTFWDNLTRTIDGKNIAVVAKDPKDWTDDPRPRVYIPRGAPEQFEFYSKIAQKHPDIRLDVQWLAEEVTPEYVRDLNTAPGLLAVAMDPYVSKDGEKTLRGKPFLVPGGRFNELYGWDSYMASLGLLLHDRVDLCKSMVENLTFCVEHYGKILNANRTYYLGRSQPPFLTDMTLRVYDRIKHEDGALDFLRRGVLAAIKEYFNIWVNNPRFDDRTGLSKYRPAGIGVPPETEASHFQKVLEPYATKHKMTLKQLVDAYNYQKVNEPELDLFFLHDRAVRESGHDTTYRLEHVAGDLVTVDLNSCLYKVECDISRCIRSLFGDQLVIPQQFQVKGMAIDRIQTSASWDRRAKRRRLAMDKYLWNEEKGMYFDYNTAKQQQSSYESVTTFWAMWAGVATPRQAAAMVIKALPRFECFGGLVAGTEASRGKITIHRPNRQWDYPFAWAPHQLLAWTGFQRYGYKEEAERLCYRWIYMVTKCFVDFNGIVVEKYNVTRPLDAQKVDAEYGNQGSNFKCIPREGFGWVNASYVVGLSIVNAHMKRALGTLTTWDTFEKSTRESSVYARDISRWELDAPKSGYLKQGHLGSAHFQESQVEKPLHPPRSHQ